MKIERNTGTQLTSMKATYLLKGAFFDYELEVSRERWTFRMTTESQIWFNQYPDSIQQFQEEFSDVVKRGDEYHRMMLDGKYP